jgi:hypothetical protein
LQNKETTQKTISFWGLKKKLKKTVICEKACLFQYVTCCRPVEKSIAIATYLCKPEKM